MNNSGCYKLLVSGPNITEDHVFNTFFNYGNPKVVMGRDSKYAPVATMEFAHEKEAENAILNLNGKPPLNWSVSVCKTR